MWRINQKYERRNSKIDVVKLNRLPYNAIEMIYVRIERLNDWRDKR